MSKRSLDESLEESITDNELILHLLLFESNLHKKFKCESQTAATTCHHRMTSSPIPRSSEPESATSAIKKSLSPVSLISPGPPGSSDALAELHEELLSGWAPSSTANVVEQLASDAYLVSEL